MEDRLRAVCDLLIPVVRENAGLHDYDGVIQDLSPDGVAAGLARLGAGAAPAGDHDVAHLRAFEDLLRVTYGDLEDHRTNPLVHLDNLDLSVYEREYAPAAAREAARSRHLTSWPDAVDMALASLDRVAKPTAAALLGAVTGLASGLDESDATEAAALTAQRRLVTHLERAAAEGAPDPAIGAAGLTRLLSAGEAIPVDLSGLAADADAERDRLRSTLDEACGRLGPGRPVADVIDDLLADHPDAAGVIDEARAQVEEAVAFTHERNLVPGLDGECLVGPTPPARRWAFAMMAWAAPYEPDAPSWYHITPPDPGWPPEQQKEWLEAFNRTTLPAITVHEVAPGHFAHGRVMRRAPTDVRKTLMSMAFIEGWAHYAEELCLDEGFRADDPRFAAGVAIEALVRVTRLAVSIGVHSGEMTIDEAARRFENDAFLKGPAARSEAARATFDPTYGRYTWGKLEILKVREQARAAWGAEFSLQRFHKELLDLAAPPLGLMASGLGLGV
ncbi:MAG: putative secreted protein [Acidimicrobiales bacterium]|nr:putative secreted protein [Acidimicrobiales bacterium]